MEPRNLVICSDGTSQVWGSNDSNVVRMVRHCAKDATQLVFYDPGVGTDEFFPPTSISSKLNDYRKTLAGLAFGRGIYDNVAQCYQFLVQNYRAGDRIFMFGFSRGAFTVRSVSGLVRLFGIARPDARPLLPLLLRAYFASSQRTGDRHALAEDLKQHFTDDIGRKADIHFIGVWDTVATVGSLVSERISANASVREKPIGHIRHAVSVGEYRAQFAPRLYEETLPEHATRDESGRRCWKDQEGRDRSFQQRWFRGVHIDVGGGAASTEEELAYVPLRWMVGEALRCGLKQAPNATFERVGSEKKGTSSAVHDQALRVPFWALTGLQRRPPPDPYACDPSLRPHFHDPAAEVGRAFEGARDHLWLWGSLFATLGFYALTSWITSRISNGRALDLAWLQLRAPVADATLRARYAEHVGWALGADVLFIAAYTTLLCVLSVHAVRSLRDFKAGSLCVHSSLRWAFQLPLLGASGFDLLEDVLTVPFLTTGSPSMAWPLAVSSALKFLSLALLALLLSCAFLRVAFRRLTSGARNQVHTRQPEEPPSGPRHA